MQVYMSCEKSGGLHPVELQLGLMADRQAGRQSDEI